ncbi:YdcF family protein [Sphingomonas sp. ID0503]|uniref:YdcF family protein n=1 Tax=Sphingomonas sp. ID0503 TaxID=3399691 RepID=UPI003AFB35FA
MIARLFSLLLIVWALGFGWFASTLPAPADNSTTDAIVVLTGGAGRIERGVALLSAGKAKRLLVSGVDPTVRPHELALQAKAPAALFDCCVDLGREAVDTRSNADETVRWLRRRHYVSVRLVTTDWHMPRARFELERALGREGAAVTILADAVRSEPGFAMLLAEYNKYLLRRMAVIFGL